MFLSEWREFPSVPCLAGKKNLDDSSRLDVVEIARVPDMFSELGSLLVGLRTYQHPGITVYRMSQLSFHTRTNVERQMNFATCCISLGGLLT